MGLKSLLLLNKNSVNLYYNNSFFDLNLYNRIIYFFFFLNKLILNYFNNYSLFIIINKFKCMVNFNAINNFNKVKSIYFGRINILIFQKWFIIIVSSLTIKNIKRKNKNFRLIKYFFLLKKKKIEL